jgi:signal transduction histidine kinase
VTALARLLRSAAFRLSLIFVVIFSIGAGLVGLRVAGGVRHLLQQEVTAALDAETESLVDQARLGGQRGLVEAVERRAREPGASLYLVTDEAGRPLAGNAPKELARQLERDGLRRVEYVAADPDREARPGARRPERERAHAMARIEHLHDIGLRLLVGRDLDERERIGRAMRGALGGSMLWMAAIGVLAGVFASWRAMRRVDAMSEAARRVTAGDLEARLPRTFSGDELDRLGDSVNRMVERIAALLRGMRDVSDNVAHDLKTPLTRLRNRAEEALRAAPGGERQALERVIDDSDALIRVFDSLLMIARAESGAAVAAMEPFDLSASLAGLHDLYAGAAEAQGATLDCAVTPGLIVAGRPELISQAVGNLLDNALKYGLRPGGGRIAIEARRVGASVEIVVADDGRGVPPNDRERVLDRFVRLDTARDKPGSGLGLSLAAAAARLHGGVLELSDNRPGLRATIRLPAEPPALEKSS